MRSSTKDFIKELTKKENWTKLLKLNIQKEIENSNWFFLSWKNDPTVVSILNMLCLIEEYFAEITYNQLNNITFEVLYLDEFNLTDELYVKMNARGKPLTIFENFKAEFEVYIEQSDKDPIQIEKNKAKLDNDWLNIFWNLAKDKVEKIEDAPKLADQMFYNFFYNATFNLYLESVLTLTNTGKNYNKIEDFLSENSIFDFYKIVYDDNTKIVEIILLLDNLDSNKETFSKFVESTKISQWDRARFYSLSLGYINNLNQVELQRWERVCFNLINNQLIQSPDDLINTIKSLKYLMEKSNKDIYSCIKDGAENISYFSKLQREEESLKASLIIENEDWERELTHKGAERNWYLEGQVGFLLDFSSNNIDQFIIYRDKFETLWDFAKNQDKKVEKNNQLLIYKALLTKGNYLPALSSNNTFCSFEATSVRARNDNWRKVFNSDKLKATEDDTKRKYYLQNLLDDDAFDIKNIGNSLNSIINKSSIIDYRKYFINNKLYIDYCKKLQIRYISETQIYLLRTTQMNGTHCELFSWDLFNTRFGLLQANKRKNHWRLESEKVYEPFNTTWYYESTSCHNPPCIVLSDFKFGMQNIQLDIGFTKGKYYLSIYDNDENDLNDQIKELSIKLGFNEEHVKSDINHSDILIEVENICSKLKVLQ